MEEPTDAQGVKACIDVAKEQGLPDPDWSGGYPVWKNVQVPQGEPAALPGTWTIKVIGGRSPPNVAFPANDEVMEDLLDAHREELEG